LPLRQSITAGTVLLHCLQCLLHYSYFFGWWEWLEAIAELTVKILW